MPSDSAVTFSFREFLVPRKLMSRCGAEDNPLFIYSQRRARRPWRRLLRHALEATLVALGFLLMFQPRPQPFLVFVLAFLLLRYLLFVNDMSHHIKTLNMGHLQQLLLARLTKEDFFLHHFLSFCNTYRALYGFFAILMAELIYSTVDLGFMQAAINLYAPLVTGFSLVMLTWVAGTGQYVLEWRVMAGGRSRLFQSVGTWVISIVLTTVVGFLSLMFGLAPIASGIFLVAVFFGLAAPIYGLARITHRQALELLWERIAREDPDRERARREPHESKEITLRAILLPWNWRNVLNVASSPEARAIGFGNRRQTFYCILLALIFGTLLVLLENFLFLMADPQMYLRMTASPAWILWAEDSVQTLLLASACYAAFSVKYTMSRSVLFNSLHIFARYFALLIILLLILVICYILHDILVYYDQMKKAAIGVALSFYYHLYTAFMLFIHFITVLLIQLSHWVVILVALTMALPFPGRSLRHVFRFVGALFAAAALNMALSLLYFASIFIIYGLLDFMSFWLGFGADFLLVGLRVALCIVVLWFSLLLLRRYLLVHRETQ